MRALYWFFLLLAAITYEATVGRYAFEHQGEGVNWFRAITSGIFIWLFPLFAMAMEWLVSRKQQPSGLATRIVMSYVAPAILLAVCAIGSDVQF